MTSIQPLPITFDILEKLPAQTGDITTIIYNDPSYAANRFGITQGYQSNGFITELYAYCEIESLDEVPLPDYQLEDTQSDKIIKTLNSVWGPDTPKYFLQLWRWKASANTWYPRGKISLTNPSGYPYTISRPLDLLTDNVARDMGEGFKLGVSIVDAGNGFVKSNDSVIIDGSWKQDVRIVMPDQPVISVQGASVTNVTQYANVSSSTTGTTRKIMLNANTGRISATIQNTHASNTIYIAYSDYTPNATTNDGAIAAGSSRNVTSGYKGIVYSTGSALNTSYTVTEVYQQ